MQNKTLNIILSFVVETILTIAVAVTVICLVATMLIISLPVGIVAAVILATSLIYFGVKSSIEDIKLK